MAATLHRTTQGRACACLVSTGPSPFSSMLRLPTKRCVGAVSAIAFSAHRAAYLMLIQHAAVFLRSIRAAAVGLMQLVRRDRKGELPRQQVGGRRDSMAAVRGVAQPPPALRRDGGFAHQPRHPMAPHPLALGSQQRMQPWTGAAATVVRRHAANRLDQRPVGPDTSALIRRS